MMKLRSMVLSLLVCVCLVTVTAFARNDSNGQADKTAAIEKEILRLEELGRQKALKGDKEWDDLMADGAYLIVPDGTIQVYQKGQNLSSMSLTSFKLSELIVRVYGDAAVVTGLAEVGSETAEKKPFSFKMRYLNVWKKSDDGWKIAVAERTMVRPIGK